MKREEIVRLEDVRGSVPLYPVKFTIDGEPFSFCPLPLSTLLLIERMKEELGLNQKIMAKYPLLEWVLVTRRQTDRMRKIVALLLNDGGIDFDVIKERLDFLREHCNAEDLCSLFLIGTQVQNLWMQEAGTESPADLDGISEHDLWSKPFVKLFKKS